MREVRLGMWIADEEDKNLYEVIGEVVKHSDKLRAFYEQNVNVNKV